MTVTLEQAQQKPVFYSIQLKLKFNQDRSCLVVSVVRFMHFFCFHTYYDKTPSSKEFSGGERC